jgi:glyoxylate reductase
MLYKPVVYVTRNLPEPGPSMLSRYCHIKMNDSVMATSKRQMIEKAKEVDAIICMLGDKIDSEVIYSAGNRLKLISCYSAGYDHVDLEAAKNMKIVVTNTPEILSETTADLTFALIFAVSRNVVKGDYYVKKAKWKLGWTPDLFLGTDVYGKVLGIIGLGNIGTKVARRAKGFEMDVIYYNRTRRYELESKFGLRCVGFHELLRSSDFISIHVDLNKETYHMISLDELKRMKKTAFLINTARGKVVKEKDLVHALNKGLIAGAGLDVYEEEPVSKGSPLLRASNTVLLPHLGSATQETRSRMAEMAAMNVINFFREIGPVHRVN